MTYEQIVQILEDNEITPQILGNWEDLDMEDFEFPEGFTPSKSREQLIEISNKIYEKLRAHTRYGKNVVGAGDELDKEYLELLNKWQETEPDTVLKNELIKSIGLPEFEIVEDEIIAGDEAVKVFHFKDGDVYIKLEGYYSSYDGMNFENTEFKQVFPVQKMTTYYLTKEEQ